jgi:hypothetical protein
VAVAGEAVPCAALALAGAKLALPLTVCAPAVPVAPSPVPLLQPLLVSVAVEDVEAQAVGVLARRGGGQGVALLLPARALAVGLPPVALAEAEAVASMPDAVATVVSEAAPLPLAQGCEGEPRGVAQADGLPVAPSGSPDAVPAAGLAVP